MGANALKARGILRRFQNDADKAREERRATAADTNLKDDVRNELVADIEWRAKARYEERCERARKVFLEARADYDRFTPRVSQMRAALGDAKQVDAVKSMALGASVADLLKLARICAEENDLPGAHGVRLALKAGAGVNNDRTQEAEFGRVHAVLDGIAPADGESARADYVATKLEYQKLLAAGPLNDPMDGILTDPKGAITRERTFDAMDTEDATVRNLTDEDRTRFQELAGTLSKDLTTLHLWADTEPDRFTSKTEYESLLNTGLDGYGTRESLTRAHAGTPFSAI